MTCWYEDSYYQEGGTVGTLAVYPDRATAELAKERYEKLGHGDMEIEKCEFTFDEVPDIVQCPSCNGSGKVPVKCLRCGGSGYSDIEYHTCTYCEGTKMVDRECDECRGYGYLKAEDAAATEGARK